MPGRTQERGEEEVIEEKEAVKLDPGRDFNFQSGCGRWQGKEDGRWEGALMDRGGCLRDNHEDSSLRTEEP